MELRLTAHRIELTEELRDFIERRVRFGIGRMATRIRSMAVRVKDVNGPRGGIDRLCDVQLDLGLNKPVIISERRDNVFSAVAIALRRAGRAARRRLADARDLRPRAAAPRRARSAPDSHDALIAAVAAAMARQ